ncbi:hypothetical protein F4678DRAFT_448724 [Xylaria arbuscula]|nr:hypothetical protein F4678DRAFT_448724 [Xylaria arbuscula]
MHKSTAGVRPRSICQICESISIRRHRPATPLIATRNASQQPYQRRRATTPFTTPQNRALSSTAAPSSKRTIAGKGSQSGIARAEKDHGPSSQITLPTLHPSTVAALMGHLRAQVAGLTAIRGIPPEENVRASLELCNALADWFASDEVQPQIAHAISELDSTASTLLSLDSGTNIKAAITTAAPKTAVAARPSQLSNGVESSKKLNEVMNKISETAYLILAHPPVVITPEILDDYVKIQAKLGKPETLPKAFQLYASKPLPREGSAPLSYTEQNPNRAANAIESKTVDVALDAAIAAKNLDAAVGIIENSYATTAFVRSKLLRNGLVPLGAFAATPVAAYILAMNFSDLQQTMDSATATNVAFAGILAYVGFTASLGVVAVTTANDQMKRVTWAPGMPLRKRWIREEERAALDKIACAWGFQELWRQGEEEGADWEALREYISQKGMILDRAELMEGMD